LINNFNNLILGGVILKLQLIINGLIYGIIVAVSTMGLTITTKILNFFNFAHGTIMTLCAFLVFSFNVGLNLPIIVSVLLAIPLSVIVALCIDSIIYVKMRKAASVALLMTSIGVTFAMRSLIKVIYGGGVKFYDVRISKGINILGINITSQQILIIILSIIAMYLVHLFMSKTKIGKSMRAVSGNPVLGEVTGINPELIYKWAWGLGTTLAALGGFFLALDTRLVPTMGWNILIPIFVAMVIGGIGSIYGAVIGGLIVGFAMEIAAGFIPATYKLGVAFIIMIVVLLWKPMGLFEEKK